VTFSLAARLFDRRVGLWSAALLAISPLHIWYSQEARMYVLVAALGLCSAYAMLLALEEGRLWHWLAYVLSTALVMNAHYFAVFLVPFQNAYVLYLLVRRRASRQVLLRWLVSQIAVGLLSVIGLAGIFSSESGYWWGLLDTWHGAPGISELLDLMGSFSLGNTVQGPFLYRIGLVVFGLCILANLIALVRSRSSRSLSAPELSKDMDGLVFVVLYLVVPLGSVFLVSQARSFWVLRYIFPFLPPYCILVARGIRSMPSRLRVAAIGMVLLLTAWPIANTYRYEQKENWRAATQYIAAQEQSGDVIVLVDEDIWLPFEHYYRGSTRRLGISRAVDDRDLLAARVGMIAPGYQRLWLVLSHTDNWMLRDVLKSSPLAELVSERSFTGVHVDLFLIHVDKQVRSSTTSLVQRIAGCTA
jgi:4-amino-4-deoxy-L-arabinose transferase-like glycosyltransferase